MLLAVALSTVISVDIESSSSYKGRTYGPVAMHIVRSRNDFISNGAPVSGAAVQALIDALRAPAMSQPTAEALQVGGAALESQEPASMRQCSGVSATQTAQDAYQQRFDDATALARFLQTYYTKPQEADSAILAFSITVRSSDGQVTASSSSTKAGRLPFTITRDGATVTTYDASIPNAVYALLPPRLAPMLPPVNELNREWGLSVCDDDMTELAFRDALPDTFAFAQEHGLELHGFANGDPINGVYADIWKSDAPRIAMHYNADASGGDAASVMALQSCSNALHRISTIPWLQKVLAANPNATVNVDDPSMTGGVLDALEVQQLRGAGFGRAASLLADNLRTVLSFWVWLKPDKEATEWYLLPSGDALLVHYLPAEERLPFDPQMNATIHRRGKLFMNTPTITVGALVSPAGTLEP